MGQMKKLQEELQSPLNSEERFLYAIAHRLNIIIEQNNSIIDHIAKQDRIATTEHKSEDKVVQNKADNKDNKDNKEDKEAKPEPKKRAPRKKKEE